MNLKMFTLGLAAMCALAFVPVTTAHAQQDSALLDALVKKGVLSDQEREDITADEAKDYSMTAASKINLASSIKTITFYGDLRLRYELRSADTKAGDLVNNATSANNIINHNDSQDRSRWRYRMRFGFKGDLYDNFFYGMRAATGYTNDRSGNVTLGDSANGGVFGNAKGLVGIDRAYLGWKPTSYLTLTGGKMENPLYTTTMMWSGDLSPTGAAEQFDNTYGSLEIFGTAGQFVYGDSADDSVNLGSGAGNNFSDVFMYVEQAGFKYKFDDHTFFKAAASFYTYSGNEQGAPTTVQGLYSGAPLVVQSGTTANENNSPTLYNGPFTGFASAPGSNVTGINDLAVIETPMEFDFVIGPGRHMVTDPNDPKAVPTESGWSLPMRVFADFAYNTQASDRADAARHATTLAANGVTTSGATAQTGATGGPLINAPAVQGVLGSGKAFIDQSAYQLGVEVGQSKKKGDWDGMVYYQSTGYYAIDPNLNDADIFNAATNMQGAIVSASYNWTDGLTSTLRYAYGEPVNHKLATPNVNQDSQVSDMHAYNLFQADLIWKF